MKKMRAIEDMFLTDIKKGDIVDVYTIEEVLETTDGHKETYIQDSEKDNVVGFIIDTDCKSGVYHLTAFDSELVDIDA